MDMRIFDLVNFSVILFICISVNIFVINNYAKNMHNETKTF